ncbi:MAG: hypothetical protein AAGD25_16850 [Cyanobacteria bacterium P01_F01_bin.150]
MAYVRRVPSVVVPFFVDQPFGGDRTLRLDTSAASIPTRSLSTARLIFVLSNT